MAQASVCTLFEGHYHLGLAGLINSLYMNDYRGPIYAGYRGSLPKWTSQLKEVESIQWENSKSYEVNEGLFLHFLPLDTKNHFANYKPDFMLELWEGPALGSPYMFYFDPDIVIARSWLLFEEWASSGIAVSEDINSPLSRFHPRRVAWRRYFELNGLTLNFKDSIYVNSGFIGISLQRKSFIELWKNIQEKIAPLIGGLELSIFKPDHLESLMKIGGPFMPFATADQDALNIAIEAGNEDVSFIGKSGMGFQNGFVLMEHAIGNPKPWRWKPFSGALHGNPPRNVDYLFWKYAEGPVKAFSSFFLMKRNIAIKITALIGRFYKRN